MSLHHVAEPANSADKEDYIALAARRFFAMYLGVYGSGYLGTVVSACLADFGTPVTCCHEDSSRMVQMAQGNIPFHEKNLSEIIRRLRNLVALRLRGEVAHGR